MLLSPVGFVLEGRGSFQAGCVYALQSPFLIYLEGGELALQGLVAPWQVAGISVPPSTGLGMGWENSNPSTHQVPKSAIQDLQCFAPKTQHYFPADLGGKSISPITPPERYILLDAGGVGCG